ncbi:Uncharacterized protein PBTT_07229 [Plasmodiophora brassicae]|uniref:Uncharacterized protein n=1 Tax=Plasmodiophora brassicae TaxID=37360 RepID=A0A0G4IXQ4_PLABS|nr:hypothetical protein PBRA_007648 [Plasmodiophora brassicae]
MFNGVCVAMKHAAVDSFWFSVRLFASAWCLSFMAGFVLVLYSGTFPASDVLRLVLIAIGCLLFVASFVILFVVRNAVVQMLRNQKSDDDDDDDDDNGAGRTLSLPSGLVPDSLDPVDPEPAVPGEIRRIINEVHSCDLGDVPKGMWTAFYVSDGGALARKYLSQKPSVKEARQLVMRSDLMKKPCAIFRVNEDLDDVHDRVGDVFGDDDEAMGSVVEDCRALLPVQVKVDRVTDSFTLVDDTGCNSLFLYNRRRLPMPAGAIFFKRVNTAAGKQWVIEAVSDSRMVASLVNMHFKPVQQISFLLDPQLIHEMYTPGIRVHPTVRQSAFAALDAAWADPVLTHWLGHVFAPPTNAETDALLLRHRLIPVLTAPAPGAPLIDGLLGMQYRLQIGVFQDYVDGKGLLYFDKPSDRSTRKAIRAAFENVKGIAPLNL